MTSELKEVLLILNYKGLHDLLENNPLRDLQIVLHNILPYNYVFEGFSLFFEELHLQNIYQTYRADKMGL